MKNISVIGAGTMGNGIAHVFAQNGYKVNLIDVSENSLEKAIKTISKNLDRMVAKEKITSLNKDKTLQNLSVFSDLKNGIKEADLVIEAATENLDTKLSIFKTIDNYSPENCILATNTSSISITKIAANTSRPDKVIGMHFMNPVPIMKLIEVIKGYSTSQATIDSIMILSKEIGKSPVEVNDFPGFVANKILMPMINEAIITLNEGVAGAEEIDTVMKLGMAHPMGPLQLADFIGLDVCLAILKVLQDGFGTDKYAPSPLLVNMVTAGKLGVKSGEGFYSWKHGTKELIVSDYFKN
ncbi:MAG: 3-hydroxybutyryl-CoA dehydrogenase [Flavobacteriales bacterium]|nr:3-hydroxybutyryl-CoA dehydrogenase [Flavobacteriales bacterium]